jgi:protocatechuate 3,4-dioxygenase beta subunit
MRDNSRVFAVTRRGFLYGCGAALAVSKMRAASPQCTLTAEQEQGPYYIDYGQLRSDITEGKPGVPLKLRIALVDAKGCAPMKGAAIDLWHCDAAGVYSGFAGGPGAGRGFGPPLGREGFRPEGPPPARITDESRFLRGTQVTDESGAVEFATVYPGWYQGRTIHIHMKVHYGGHVAHTGQLFLPEEITSDVAKLEPYAKRASVHRTTHEEDGVFTGQHGDLSVAGLTRLKNGSNASGFLATATLAIDPEATPAPVGIGGGRGRGRRG